MHDDLFRTLRCPIDPSRTTTLHQDKDQVICDGCAVRYPVKQGLPILIIAEAELPEKYPEMKKLPCLRNRS